MYLPAVGETVYLIPPGGYNYLAKCPLVVRDIRNKTAWCEFTTHPAFVNGARHKANDMRGFQITCTLNNLVPEILKDAVIFYRNARLNIVQECAVNGWLNLSKSVIDGINEKYRQDKGLEIGCTYSIELTRSRTSKLTGKVYSKKTHKEIKIIARNSAKFHHDAIYTVLYEGKEYKIGGRHSFLPEMKEFTKIG